MGRNRETVEQYIMYRSQDDFIVFTVRNCRDVILYDTRETPYEPKQRILDAVIENIYADEVPMLEVYI